MGTATSSTVLARALLHLHPIGSAVIYRLIAYVIMFMLMGKIHSEMDL